MCRPLRVVPSALATADHATVAPLRSAHRAGLGALELFASGMKALGTYVGRSLSYNGAEFMVEQADIEPEYRRVHRGERGGEAG
jgi:hypothetical protein